MSEVNKITALPVERDKYGYWTHPLYNEFCDGREFIDPEEFNQWLKTQGLAWSVQYRDEEDIDPGVDGYDISTWHPESPIGEGWFIASIHDTEDGAVCIWLRDSALAANESNIHCCELCGHPMPPGEEMFKFHGYSGPCPETTPDSDKTAMDGE